jgi:hypothetical protein
MSNDVTLGTKYLPWISDFYPKLAGDQHYCAHDNEENTADEFHYMGGEAAGEKGTQQHSQKSAGNQSQRGTQEHGQPRLTIG